MRRLKRFLNIIKLYTVSGLKVNNSEKYFFIIGSGRCGSTLLRVILERDSKIIVLPEINEVLPELIEELHIKESSNKIELFDYLFDRYSKVKNWHELKIEKEEVRTMVEGKQISLATFLESIFKLYAKQKGESVLLYGDKHPYLTFYIPYLKVMFPKAKFIHMIRDGRDVVTSWGKTKGLDKDLVEAAKRWNWALKEVERFKFLITKRLIEVKYEDLVNAPERTVKRISDFLKVEYRSEFLDTSINNSTTEVNNEHHKGSGSDINTSSIGRWRKDISNKELDSIMPIIQKRLRKYGYL